MKTSDIERWLVRRVADAGGVAVEDVDVYAPFADYGIDSATAAQIAGEIAELVDTPVAATALFDHPSIVDFADALSAPSQSGLAAPERSASSHEPIAVVGIGCRFPGAVSPAAFWELLVEGREAVGPVPPDRWPADLAPETVTIGGFLDDIAGFDAGYFRIPREEALRMDPQQRLLLEVAVECLEDAGVPDAAVRGSRTGVFVGISSNEYAQRQVRDERALSGLTPTGNALSIAANRISYTFDLRGPSIAVDTACSSSLVAVHLALRALQNGDCTQAIVAGVNLLLEPETSIALGRGGFLARDGRCKAFDAAADGYGRGEGCGAVLLKPLSLARSDADRVYAIVLGAAVNQDGRSNGLTAPNPTSQEDVLRAAYVEAAVDPRTVSYVECHGTGTLLGDPIEVRSLSRVLAGPGRERPLLIGSAKTNVGHLESAAGMTGFIKTALSLHAGVMPPSRNFTTPNPNIPFKQLGVEIVTRSTPWPVPEPVAGVSSFGFGGTNAHIVMAAAPTSVAPPRMTADGPMVLPVSAASEQAFTETAKAFGEHLGTLSPDDAAAFARSALTRRSHYPIRGVAIGATAAALASQLANLAAMPPARARRAGRPRIGFIFSGQGSQQVAMARVLLRSDRLFRSVIERCDEILDGVLPHRLVDLIEDDRFAPRLDDTELAQPLIVAVQAALVEVLGAYGVRPTAVVGHSVGEIGAAYAAGAVALDEAILLAQRRGAAMAPTQHKGRMLAVGLDERAARELLAGSEDRVEVAAVNGPSAIVLSGEVRALRQLEAVASAAGHFVKWLPVKYAFHSRQMDEAAAALADIPTAEIATDVRFYSTVVGALGHEALAEPGYWSRNVRHTVRFADAVGALVNDGIDVLVEISPSPVLQTPLRQITRGLDDEVTCAAVATSDADDATPLLEALALLYRSGASIDWVKLAGRGQPFSPYPTYRWQHEPLLLERPMARIRDRGAHPLLGSRVDLAGPNAPLVWESEIAADEPAMLVDHRVGDVVVMPASAYIEVIVAAARAAGVGDAIVVENVRLPAFLVLDADHVRLQTTLVPADGEQGYRANVHTRSAKGDETWVLRASALVSPGLPEMPPADLAGAQLRCLEQIPAPLFYGTLAEIGLRYGPAFRVVDAIWRSEGEAFARVAAGNAGYEIDPCALDGGFQLVAAAAGLSTQNDGELRVPVGLERIVVARRTAGEPLTAHVRLRSIGALEVADIALVDANGRSVVDIRGLQLQRVLGGRGVGGVDLDVWMYDTSWIEKSLSTSPIPLDGKTAVIAGAGPTALIADALRVAGATVEFLDVQNPTTPTDGDVCAVDGYQAQLRALRTDGRTVDVLVYAAGGDELAPQRAIDISWDLVALVQAVSFSEGARLPTLWVVTSGAQSIGVVDAGSTDAVDPWAATAWGVAKVMPFENPALPCRCVDVDHDKASFRALVIELAAPTDDAEIAFRRGLRFVRRLVPATTEPLSMPVELDAEGVYVVTGGTGGIGPYVARWLADRGASRVAVLSRSGVQPGTSEALGGESTVLDIRCDIAERTDVESALADIRRHGPIRGIVHAAGVLADGALLSLSAQQFAEPLRAKVAGACWLHELTADEDPWIAFFASAAGVLGSPGQGNYAAANAFLDAYATSLRAAGRVAFSVDWGPWAAGMAAEWTGGQSGAVKLLRPDDALAAFERLLQEQRDHTLVLPFDLRDLLQFFPRGVGFAFFDELQTAEQARLRNVGANAGRVARPALAEEYVAPRNDVEDRIAQIWQIALGIEEVGAFDGFFELGGDSVFANQIIVEVNHALGVALDAERAFEDFTVAHLADLAENQLIDRLDQMTDDEAAGQLVGLE
jgi:Polyketide synthase modules and related proteins